MHFNQSLESIGSSVASRLPQYVKVPFSNEVKAVLKQTKNEILAYEKLLQSQGKKYKDIFGSHLPEKLKNQPISFKGISHIRIPEIKEIMKKDGNIKKRLSGMHWDQGRQLEKAGLYALENCEELVDGMYKANITCNGVTKAGKTFFPSSWDFKTLASKITEACSNVTEIKNLRGGIIEITGEISEQFKIRIRFNKRGKILTTYPLIEG